MPTLTPKATTDCAPGVPLVSLHPTCGGPRAVTLDVPAVSRFKATPSGVILCHGMFSSRDGTKQEHTARALRQSGWPVLRFDFAGRGQSPGGPDAITIGSQLHDLAAAWRFAHESLGWTSTALIGSSFGALTALASLYTDGDLSGAPVFASGEVSALALISTPHRSDFTAEMGPPGTIELWREGGYLPYEGVSHPFRLHDELTKLPCMDAMLGGLTMPLCLIHGELDNLFPVAAIQALWRALPPAKHVGRTFHIVPQAGHRLDEPHQVESVTEQILTFFSKVPLC